MTDASVSVVFAVIAGLLFAIPWAGLVAPLFEPTGPDPAPVLWHELHTVAGLGFALSLLELRRRYPAWFGASARISVALAIASALAFSVSNVGQALGALTIFYPLYFLSLVALSGALIIVARKAPTLPAPLPLLLTVLGLAAPAVLLFGALVPPPAGIVTGAVGLMAYGLLWTGFGFVQLSRDP